MDQFGIFVFDLCDAVYGLDTKGDKECDRQHWQDKHEIVENQIDVSSMRKRTAL